MIDKISSYWNFGSEYCSLEHSSDSQNIEYILGIVASRKNEEYDIINSFTYKNPQEVSSELKKNQHCFLTITNNQVLIKATDTTGSEQKIISAAFPNIDISEFYYEILKTPIKNFVAICRIDSVNVIIKNYHKYNLQIIGFSLGFLSIHNLISVIKAEEIYISKFVLQITNGQLLSFEKNNDYEEVKYQIEDITISSKYLLSLASLFNYNEKNNSRIANSNKRNVDLRTGHKQKVFFRKGLLVGLGILLISLLVNFLLFTNYYTELQHLSEKYDSEISKKKAYDLKYEKIAEKEKTVLNILKNSTSRNTFYLNRLINSKPNSISLTEFTFQPLYKQIKENEPISLDTSRILIVGESNDEIAVSQWVKRMESLHWINEVLISDFSYKTNKSSEFTLKLTLKKDEAKD